MECKDLQTQGMWSEGLGTHVMSATEIMGVLRSFGMGKFTAAVMWVLQEMFVDENENGGRQQEQLKTTFCPQADFEGEQLLINDERLMIIHTLSIKRGVHQATQVHDCPWLLCEPNEVEGRILLAEIIQGGNFGQYDTRDAELKKVV